MFPSGESTRYGAPFFNGGAPSQGPSRGAAASRTGAPPSSSFAHTETMHPVASRNAASTPGSSVMTVERHPHHVAVVGVSLDAIHQLGHEEESASLLTKEVLGACGVDEALADVEA